MLETLRQDVKVAARSLWRSRGFAAAAVLTVALGIGANTVVFSAVNAVLLRPLPVDRPEELVAVFTSDFSGPAFGASSYRDFEDFAAADVFAGAFAYRPNVPLTVPGDTLAERRMATAVTGTYFDVLGVRPDLGRLLTPADDRPGSPLAVVLSHGLWQREFGGRPGVIGQTVTLTGASSAVFTIVGVAPRRFAGVRIDAAPDLWIPLSAGRTTLGLNDRFFAARGSRGLLVMARLRTNADAAQAEDALAVAAARLHAESPSEWSDVRGNRRRVTVLPERLGRFDEERSTLVNVSALLLGVVAVVLLVACANLANLLLARASRRRIELGVRVALGARGFAIVRQSLVESLLIAVAGGTAGIAVSAWLLGAIERAAAALPVVLWRELTIDGHVLAFGAAVTVLTGLVSGMAPAIRASRLDVMHAFRRGAMHAGSAGWARMRGGLVVVQLASSLVLLVVGGMFVRGLTDAQHVDLGFGGGNVAMFTLQMPSGRPPAASSALRQRLVEEIGSQPGVEHTSVSQFVPLAEAGGRTNFFIDGYVPAAGEDMELFYNRVGPGYFETLDVPLVRGRALAGEDYRDGTPGAAVVSEAFVRRYFPGQDALGRQLRVGAAERSPIEIVGIARDGKYRSIGEAPLPYAYLPLVQGNVVTLHVRATGNPAGLVPAVQRQIAAVDRDIAVLETKTMAAHLAQVHAPMRLGSRLLTLFAAIALVLAVVGLYSVTAYAVVQRTREIGIRMALGATRARVMRLVVVDCGWMIVSGIALGLVAGAVAARPVAAIAGVSGPPVSVGAGSTLVLLAAASVAVYVTTRRATRVNPLEAIRSE